MQALLKRTAASSPSPTERHILRAMDEAVYADSRRRPSIQVEQVRANADRTRRFFVAIAGRRLDDVVSAYAPDAIFDHPGLGRLTGPDIAAMWRAAMEQTDHIDIEHDIASAGPFGAEARWVLRMRTSPGGRAVMVRGVSAFVFDRGLIRRQMDGVDMDGWLRAVHGRLGAALALVPGGYVLARPASRRAFGLRRSA